MSAIREFQTPRSKKGVRAFLGLAGYYRRFIHNVSSIAAPLSDLTAKTMPDKVDWQQEHQLAFDELRRALQKEPVLQTPDYSIPFTLHTDASNRGVGAVLSQSQDDDSDLPVAFYSRKLLPRETRYTTTEKECLAVVNAVQHFAVYLLGRRDRPWCSKVSQYHQAWWAKAFQMGAGTAALQLHHQTPGR